MKEPGLVLKGLCPYDSGCVYDSIEEEELKQQGVFFGKDSDMFRALTNPKFLPWVGYPRYIAKGQPVTAITAAYTNHEEVTSDLIAKQGIQGPIRLTPNGGGFLLAKEGMALWGVAV